MYNQRKALKIVKKALTLSVDGIITPRTRPVVIFVLKKI